MKVEVLPPSAYILSYLARCGQRVVAATNDCAKRAEMRFNRVSPKQARMYYGSDKHHIEMMTAAQKIVAEQAEEQ